MILDHLFDIEGRVAIVTGASSGLGARFARVLAGRGARVVAAARRTEPLEQLAGEVPGITPLPCDVTDDAQLARLMRFTLEELGPPAVLVNNAGITHVAPAEAEDPADFRRVLDVNLTALYVLAQHAGRAMLEAGRGSIINISSMYGLVASSPINQSGYTASKAAVVHLTRELAAQWASRGVRVNALAPGFFPTEMTGETANDERSLRFLHRNTPMGRVGRDHELDGALVYLASDASSFMTGHTLVVDGGWTLR